jgi:hypothetical protein
MLCLRSLLLPEAAAAEAPTLSTLTAALAACSTFCA